MAVQVRDPNTIHLGGEITLVGDIAAGGEVIPGMLVDRVDGAYVAHAAADGVAQPAFALEQSEMNAGQDQSPHKLTIDYPYALGDLMQVGIGKPGSSFYALIASGENIADGATLSSAGDGTLQGSTTLPVASAIEDVDNSAGPGTVRIRVEAL
jgi:hypothetical protein